MLPAASRLKSRESQRKRELVHYSTYISIVPHELKRPDYKKQTIFTANQNMYLARYADYSKDYRHSLWRRKLKCIIVHLRDWPDPQKLRCAITYLHEWSVTRKFQGAIVHLREWWYHVDKFAKARMQVNCCKHFQGCRLLQFGQRKWQKLQVGIIYKKKCLMFFKINALFLT